jgi:hypothetical protein
MENINRHNYEAFFLDYHEGSLSPEQVAELLLFLEQNPDLKERFSGFENIILPQDSNEGFTGKDKLKKSIITPANCETYFISDTEGMLSVSERKALDRFLLDHPEYIKTYRLYQQAKLEPGLTDVYHGKSGLRKGKAFDPSAPLNMVAALEGELSSDEQIIFDEALRKSPALQKEYGYYNAARLQPDQSLVYPGKEKLRRRKAIIIWLPAYTYMAAAASLALLLMFWFFSHTSANTDQPALVHQKSAYSKEPAQNLAVIVPAATGTQAKAPYKRSTVAKSKQNGNMHSETPVESVPDDETNTSETILALNTVGSNTLDQPETNGALILRNADNSSPLSSTGSEANTPSAFLSLGQYAANKLLSEQLADEYRKPDNKRHVGLAFTKAAATAFNRISGRKIRVRENYDNRGELVSYAINSGSFEYARAIKR